MITGIERVSHEIKSNDLVLDVGGWACPFNRANYVIDSMPYETRGYYQTIGMQKCQGPEAESFTKATWIQRDICGPERWPFSDKQFDYAICSHTLEDVRDPLFVCSELNRVAKRGYIEVPSRIVESSLGAEHKNMVGLSHHRWLIEIVGNHIRFVQKYHLIHSDFELRLPRKVEKKLSEEDRVAILYWEGSFTYEEVFLHGAKSITGELSGFVRRHYRYSFIRYWIRDMNNFSQRVKKKIKRVIAGHARNQ